MGAHIFVGMNIYVSNFTRAPMQKRCRSELKQDFTEKFKKNDIIYSKDLMDEFIWKTLPLNDSSQTCDQPDNMCIEGYVWAKPEGFKEKATTMEYTHQATMCDSGKQYSMATSFYFIGFALGPFIFGITADKFGRRPVLLFLSTMLVVTLFYLGLAWGNGFSKSRGLGE